MTQSQVMTPKCEDVWFDDYLGKLWRGSDSNPHEVLITYGGSVGPERGGNGWLISYDGIHIHRWRRPANEGGGIVINDLSSTLTLESYGL